MTTATAAWSYGNGTDEESFNRYSPKSTFTDVFANLRQYREG